MISIPEIETKIETIESALKFWIPASYIAVGIVFIGVGTESLYDLFGWPKNEMWKTRLHKMGIVMLVLGLAIELLTTVMTSHLYSMETESLKTERAITERIIGSRKFDIEEQESFGAELTNFSKQTAQIFIYPDDFEAATFAAELAASLKYAGHWNIPAPEVQTAPSALTGKLISGIMVIPPANEDGKRAASALMDALHKHDICAGSPPDQQTASQLTIMVGNKSRGGNCR